MIQSDSWNMLGLYRHYKNSVLPFSGGVLEQPNPYLEAMGIIDSRRALIESRD